LIPAVHVYKKLLNSFGLSVQLFDSWVEWNNSNWSKLVEDKMVFTLKKEVKTTLFFNFLNKKYVKFWLDQSGYELWVDLLNLIGLIPI
jgi:hypothetical protein